MTALPAAIMASLVDVRNVNTDKEVRLEVRVPAELAQKVFEVFGWPTRVSPVAVCVFRPEAEIETRIVEAPKALPALGVSWDEMKPSQKAGIQCREKDFKRYLSEWRGGVSVDDEGAATLVRNICGVTSRKEFDTDPSARTAWDHLEADFWAWQRGRR